MPQPSAAPAFMAPHLDSEIRGASNSKAARLLRFALLKAFALGHPTLGSFGRQGTGKMAAVWEYVIRCVVRRVASGGHIICAPPLKCSLFFFLLLFFFFFFFLPFVTLDGFECLAVSGEKLQDRGADGLSLR